MSGIFLFFLCLFSFGLIEAKPRVLDVNLRFENFIEKYNKKYTEREYNTRFEIFQRNLKLIEKLNQKESGQVFGVNKFTDLSPEEFRSMYLMSKGSG